ncbi:hypothetical protein CQ018_19465 [Arthrobacter sp. MYb227]|uniref:hypothetical protein n=1 Tax=Arthrobacter sp. MYb227 TaxID=1848601 RepID=UPI000CFDD42A|nr:hypothetical protein [Arthrobacter sp. MYb227]PQZ85960.1 hypothetical protein CQ018_19465 [Arthrobacter sp. MYb227]
MDSSILVPFLLLLSFAGICVAVLLLRKGKRNAPAILDEALVRDREQLERLEEIDQRLERLEKTLHDLPS